MAVVSQLDFRGAGNENAAAFWGGVRRRCVGRYRLADGRNPTHSRKVTLIHIGMQYLGIGVHSVRGPSPWLARLTTEPGFAFLFDYQARDAPMSKRFMRFAEQWVEDNVRPATMDSFEQGADAWVAQCLAEGAKGGFSAAEM